MRLKRFLLFSVILPLLGFSQSIQAAEVTFERDASLPIVTINVAFKAGAVTDPDGESGITNFMGEMLLRGTQLHSKKELDLAFDQMGARLDVETRAESLIFRGSVLSSQLDNFLNLLEEVIMKPKFPSGEISKLKSEITSMIQEELGHDASLASRSFNKFLFRDHPYGKPISGKISAINKLNQTKIKAHYQKIVRETLLLIVGSGDAQPDKILNWSNEMGTILKASQPKIENAELIGKVPTPINSNERRLLIIDKPDRTQTQINLGQIGIRMLDKDFFPLHLSNYAFGGPSFSSTLMQEIRIKRGWSYGANSSFRFGLQPRSWSVHLFPAEKDTPDALTYTLKLLEDLKKEGLTADRFDFAKRSLINSSGFLYNTPKKRVENTLLEKTLDLPLGFIKSYGTRLSEVSLVDANKALQKFVSPEKLAITVLGTAKNLKEPLAKAAGIHVEQVEVMPYDQD